MPRLISINILTITVLTSALAVLAMPSISAGCGGKYGHWATLVQQSLADDSVNSVEAIQALRAEGQAGLDALCAEHDRLAKAGATPEQLKRLRTVIDSVAKQRDTYASRLYWHTDFAEAISAAEQSGKPILSLRLLGNLDEDASCANSRFFRSVLYANAEVSQYLRDHFILHWQSLRPVPRMTIDMGDGRQIKRTITGNSIHYVLDSRGDLVDAVPGLQSPAAFLKTLQQAELLTSHLNQLNTQATRNAALRQYHQSAIALIDRAWRADWQQLNAAPVQPAGVQTRQPAILALAAAPIAETKSEAELPVLNAMLADAGSPPATLSNDDAQIWERMATLHFADAQLDNATIAMMREKAGVQKADDAGRLSISKRRVEDPFVKMLRTFQRSLAADTVRNEYIIHRHIHEWLASQDSQTNIDAFNQRVYAELFLSPLNDPWMGLAPADVCAALDQNGLESACK